MDPHPTPDLLELAPGLFRLRIPGDGAHLLNSYVWRGDAGVTLIDTGWPDSAPLIEGALATIGSTRSDVVRIVLTHFHEDHAGAAAEIAGWSRSIVVAAGRGDADVIRGVRPGAVPALTEAELTIHGPAGDAPTAPPCRVDLELTGGEVIPIGRGGARVLATPGHTDGSIALHLLEEDLVLVGDTAAEFQGAVITGVFNLDREEVRTSLAHLGETGATAAGFGHGDAVLEDAAARIAGAPDPFA